MTDNQQQQRIKRTGPQLLTDQLISKEVAQSGSANTTGRILTQDHDPWSHNAWDNVDWDDNQDQLAKQMVQQQAEDPVPQELQQLYNADPKSFWDNFYAINKEEFFKDRAWLRTEFPELDKVVKPDAGPKRVVEIGCGPGNTLFPLFAANENPHLRLHGFDFSKEAVQLVRNNPSFDPKHIDAQVWDLSSPDGLPATLEPGTVDIAVMIFVMSALHPDEWSRAVKNVWDMLKPGGLLLFRDYGRHDMAQLRFKKGRYMQPGLYIRGDKTRVYFFERDDLVSLFGPPDPSSNLDSKSSADTLHLDTLSLQESSSSQENAISSRESEPVDDPSVNLPPPPESRETADQEGTDATAAPSSPFRFELLHLGVDRRLLLNRKKQLKMYRVWLQGRWRKPILQQ
ncbi:methyltransferase [Meredithblackwellia eburnea MCA 4105]